MKILVFCIITFLGYHSSVFAQTTTEDLALVANISNDSVPDTISIVQNHYSYKGHFVFSKNLGSIMKDDPKASHLMNNARSSKAAAGVLSLAGGFFLGYALANSLIKQKVNYELGGLGLSFIILSIPFEANHNKSTLKAISAFNYSQKAK